MASAYFYELLTSHTCAQCDQDHLNLLLSSRADTPDRTDFILGRSPSDPLPVMIGEAKRLEAAGADLLVIPCNTAHYFYDGIARSVEIPIVHILRQNAHFCRHLGLSKVGVLATEGTVFSGAYERELSACGIECVLPSADDQHLISGIIYQQIKRGKEPAIDEFLGVASRLFEEGCERVILGCTELSLLNRAYRPDPKLIDSMEVLAAAAIRLCGKEPIGFSEALASFIPESPITRKESAHAAQ